MHREIHVKVNAWVDEGVAPLVAALNHCPDIVTVDSCERDSQGQAYVYFTSHAGNVDLLDFVRRLGEKLADIPDIERSAVLKIEWVAGNLHPLAALFVQCDCMARAVLAVKTVWAPSGAN